MGCALGDERGARVVREEYFYGYQVHASLNAAAETITSVAVTAVKSINALPGQHHTFQPTFSTPSNPIDIYHEQVL
jgi:hypothetical protein